MAIDTRRCARAARGSLVYRRKIHVPSLRIDRQGVQSGNLVSHSNRKTRTRFLPNLVNVTLTSDALARSVRLRISAAALALGRTSRRLDAFLATVA